jgi:hypothetical protein
LNVPLIDENMMFRGHTHMSNLQGPPLQDEGAMALMEAAGSRDIATGLDGGLEAVDL